MGKLQSGNQLSKHRKYHIQTKNHEGAFAVSCESIVNEKNLNQIQTVIIKEFTAMNLWVLQKGGIIGHIKGFLSADGDSVMISTTGDEVYCHTLKSTGKKDGAKVSLVSIIFNISQSELESRMILMLDSLLDH